MKFRWITVEFNVLFLWFFILSCFIFLQFQFSRIKYPSLWPASIIFALHDVLRRTGLAIEVMKVPTTKNWMWSFHWNKKIERKRKKNCSRSFCWLFERANRRLYYIVQLYVRGDMLYYKLNIVYVKIVHINFKNGR